MSVILNVFRVTGDLMHLASIAFLLMKILKTKSISGLSLFSQALYMGVYVSRYLDVFYFPKFDFLHLYNFLMKILFLSTQTYVLYAMLVLFKNSYDKSFDTLKPWILVAPSLVLAAIFLDYSFATTVILFAREVCVFMYDFIG
jgi:ER lumen protein retaining receptor